jgi:hypothetical protein
VVGGKDEVRQGVISLGLREVIEREGLFCALYSDRGSHFFFTPKAGEAVEKTGPWKQWKTKPRFPTAPWKTRQHQRVFHFPTALRLRFPLLPKNQKQRG